MAERRICWIHAITPLHVGTGFGVGFVDLPIAREKTTDWPFTPGSGLKGVFADAHGASDAVKRDELARAAFGKADDEGSGQANSGALVFSDARLVCMPVRSLYGTFAWITCPLALRRLLRDLDAAGQVGELHKKVPSVGNSAIILPEGVGSELRLASDGARVFLADLDVEATATGPESEKAAVWAAKIAGWVFPDGGPQDTSAEAWRKIFKRRFGVVHDSLFNYFSSQGTEVVTRVKINPETRTAADKALWAEESLPAEAILASLVWCDRITHTWGGRKSEEIEQEIMKTYCTGAKALQVGGKATVGRGRVRAVFANK